MAKHPVKPARIDGFSLSPQKELAELLKNQSPQIFAEGKVNPDFLHHEGKKNHEGLTTDSAWILKSEIENRKSQIFYRPDRFHYRVFLAWVMDCTQAQVSYNGPQKGTKSTKIFDTDLHGFTQLNEKTIIKIQKPF